MTTKICPNCNASVEASSRFCNYCGHKMTEEQIVCAVCGKEMPADSAFCPSCGRAVNVESVAVPFNLSQPQPIQPETESQIADTQHEHSIETPLDSNTEDEDNDYWDATDSEESKSRHKRKLTITFIITFFILVAGALLYFFYFNQENAEIIETSTVAVPLSNEEALDVFQNALNVHNMLGDCATPAYAIEVAPTKQNEQQIIGLSFLSNSSGRSFFKIYRVVSDSISWNISNIQTKNFENCVLNFNTADVVGPNKEMPQFVTISDKPYFYFAYMILPAVIDAHARGKLMFCLLNVETEQITNLEYEGEIVIDSGVKKIKGQATNSSKSAESQFLHSQAEAANGIYHLSPEEEELEKAENASKKWAIENADNLKRLRMGEVDVKMKIAIYDKPIFSIANIADDTKIENENLIIVTDENGTVYGYSKTKRFYFVVYAPTGSATNTRVSFNPDGTIFVNSVAIKFNFNPRYCTATLADEIN